MSPGDTVEQHVPDIVMDRKPRGRIAIIVSSTHTRVRRGKQSRIQRNPAKLAEYVDSKPQTVLSAIGRTLLQENIDTSHWFRGLLGVLDLFPEWLLTMSRGSLKEISNEPTA